MTNYVAIIHMHRDGGLTNVVHLRTHRLVVHRRGALFNTGPTLDLGSVSFVVDDGARTRWEFWRPRHTVFNDVDMTGLADDIIERAARVGDVLTVSVPERPVVTFTLAELVEVASDRGLVITLRALADQHTWEDEGQLCAALKRAADKLDEVKP